jgi:hypothetical protein
VILPGQTFVLTNNALVPGVASSAAVITGSMAQAAQSATSVTVFSQGGSAGGVTIQRGAIAVEAAAI